MNSYKKKTPCHFKSIDPKVFSRLQQSGSFFARKFESETRVGKEKLENVYVKSSWVQQVWIHGDSLQNNVIAFVVPEVPPCKAYADEKKIAYTD